MFAVYFLQRHTTFTVFQFRNEAPTFVLALQFPATCLKIGIQRRDFLPELFQRSFEEVTRHEKMFFHICLFQLVSGLARQDNQLADYVFSTQVDTRVGLRITFFLCHLDGLAERHVCADLIKDIVQSSTEYRFYLQNLITTVYQVIDGIDNRQPRTYICLEQELHPPPAGYLFQLAINGIIR